MAASIHTNKKAIRLSIAIFLGLVLGALFGLIMPDWAEPIVGLPLGIMGIEKRASYADH